MSCCKVGTSRNVCSFNPPISISKKPVLVVNTLSRTHWERSKAGTGFFLEFSYAVDTVAAVATVITSPAVTPVVCQNLRQGFRE